MFPQAGWLAFRINIARAYLPGLALAALSLISGSVSVYGQGDVTRKRVLLLLTHESQLPAQIVLEQAMRSTLREGSQVPLEIYSEYLDAVRTPIDDYEKELVVQFQKKYGRKRFDLIITVNPPALKLLLNNRSVLFKDAPIVFFVLDQRNLEGLNPGPNVTGVWGEIKDRSNLDLALTLHPGTQRVVVITGVSNWDNYWRARVEEEFRPLEGRLQFSYLTGLSMAEQKDKLAKLPPSTIVYFVSSTQDNGGSNYGNVEVIRQISSVSTAPIYGTSDAQLGAGIVGGKLLSFEALGVDTARVGLRVLAGEKPESIPAHEVPGLAMFDWRELKRWGISENRLPAGSVVRFKVPGFWELYRGRIIAIFLLIALQSAFIAILLIERKRRQRARVALDQLNAELEQRIAARTAALDKKSRELETFAYSVAHDLKAPLRGIDGYSRLLIEDYSKELNSEARSFLDTIQTSAEEMSQLIDDLLAYSRLERRELKPDLLKLQPLVVRLIEQKKREEAERNIDFVMNVDGGAVTADANGLILSLRNYMDNAIKFTRKSSQPRIEVGSKETATSCILWVRDNGIGFDSKYHDQIFGIFQRLNHAEEYPGTGVGLAIVRKAMERMGGQAWANSEPGQGATFYLEIPKTSQN
jgi:signal transduction histidine kinase